MTKPIKKKKKRPSFWTRTIYLYIWLGIGAIAYSILAAVTSDLRTRAAFCIVLGLILSFLIDVQNYGIRPKVFSLFLCEAAIALLSALFSGPLFLATVCLTFFPMVLFLAAWKWLEQTDWEPTAARWGLYFVLVLFGFGAAQSSRLFYLVLVLALMLLVHIKINGDFQPFPRYPSTERKARRPIPALPETGSLARMMLDRARHKNLALQARTLLKQSEREKKTRCVEHEKQDGRRVERSDDKAHSHS